MDKSPLQKLVGGNAILCYMDNSVFYPTWTGMVPIHRIRRERSWGDQNSGLIEECTPQLLHPRQRQILRTLGVLYHCVGSARQF